MSFRSTMLFALAVVALPHEAMAADPVPPERRGGYKDFWLASDVLEFTSHSYDGHMFDGDGMLDLAGYRRVNNGPWMLRVHIRR